MLAHGRGQFFEVLSCWITLSRFLPSLPVRCCSSCYAQCVSLFILGKSSLQFGDTRILPSYSCRILFTESLMRFLMAVFASSSFPLCSIRLVIFASAVATKLIVDLDQLIFSRSQLFNSISRLLHWLGILHGIVRFYGSVTKFLKLLYSLIQVISKNKGACRASSVIMSCLVISLICLSI